MSYAEDTDDQEQAEQAEDHFWQEMRDKAVISMQNRYNAPRSISEGMATCVTCMKRFRPKHSTQRFHNTRCKDRFHNVTNPRGYGSNY